MREKINRKIKMIILILSPRIFGYSLFIYILSDLYGPEYFDVFPHAFFYIIYTVLYPPEYPHFSIL